MHVIVLDTNQTIATGMATKRGYRMVQQLTLRSDFWYLGHITMPIIRVTQSGQIIDVEDQKTFNACLNEVLIELIVRFSKGNTRLMPHNLNYNNEMIAYLSVVYSDRLSGYIMIDEHWRDTRSLGAVYLGDPEFFDKIGRHIQLEEANPNNAKKLTRKGREDFFCLMISTALC